MIGLLFCCQGVSCFPLNSSLCASVLLTLYMRFAIIICVRTAKYTMYITVAMTGVEAHRIRRFEAAGFLAPTRSDGKHRLFSDGDIEVIREIAVLVDRGVNFEGIRHIMALRRGEAV